MPIHVRAFAFACGLIWGLSLFCMTWWIILFDGTNADVIFLGRFYRGYNITPLGSLIGLAWGLIDGLVGGFIFAWIYNRFRSLFFKD